MKKYGVTNPGAIPEVKEQVKQTMLERYGVTNVSKIPEVSQHKSELMKRISTEGDFQERRRNTCVERYGYDWLATPESREMLKKYSLETYGVEHFMKSPVYKEQRRKKFFARHGVDNPLQLNEVKEKVRQTCLKKYGVDNVFKRPELIEKRIMKLVENAKRFSSDGEDRIFEQLSQHFKHVERHVPIFYRKSLFWIVDFKISDVYVQYDGLYWHGVNMDVSELKTLREQGDRSADMQIKAIHRDRFQNYWFIENDLKLFRIIEGTSIDEWLPKLQAFIDHPPCA